MDDKVAIAHNKVILIDDTTLITGSYNFTNAAEHKNAENILIIESPALVKQYKRNWETRMDASLPFSTKSVEKPVSRTRRSAMNTTF
jgi:phosphatidylserine/phosphatidylglycerophosphate/cardiolipin synthase-like enzyme